MLYAAYGSNLYPARLRTRIPAARMTGTARVRGWSLRFEKRGADGSAKCNISIDDGEIYVAVFSIDVPDLVVLDEIEGGGYRRAALDVPGFGACQVYLAEASHVVEDLQPFTWYKSLVVAGCNAHGFPSDYIARVAAVPAAYDPDKHRHHRNSRIIAAAGLESAKSRRIPA